MGEACDQLPISSCLTGVLAHTEDRWVRGEESSGWGGGGGVEAEGSMR